MLFNRKGRVGANLLLAGALLTVSMLGVMALQAQKHAGPKKRAVAIPVSPLAVTVKTDHATYPVVGVIKITLTAKNTTSQDMRINFNNGQRYDFELYRGDSLKGEKVWQWARSRMFTMMLSSTTLLPNKSLDYTENYQPGGDGMPALAPGVYTVVATLKSFTKSVAYASSPSASATFHVK